MSEKTKGGHPNAAQSWADPSRAGRTHSLTHVQGCLQEPQVTGVLGASLHPDTEQCARLGWGLA